MAALNAAQGLGLRFMYKQVYHQQIASFFELKKTMLHVSATVHSHPKGASISKDICRVLIGFVDWKMVKNIYKNT